MTHQQFLRQDANLSKKPHSGYVLTEIADIFLTSLRKSLFACDIFQKKNPTNQKNPLFYKEIFKSKTDNQMIFLNVLHILFSKLLVWKQPSLEAWNEIQGKHVSLFCH